MRKSCTLFVPDIAVINLSFVDIFFNLEYGLGSSVYTQDTEKANRIAELIDAGQVGINCYPIEFMGVQCPW